MFGKKLLDNIIQYFDSEIGKCRFSIGEAIDSLGDKFFVYQSSPNFNTDWRWYKDIYGIKTNYNTEFKESYLSNIHSMIDFRYHYKSRSPEQNEELLNLCDKVFNFVYKYLTSYNNENKKDFLSKIQEVLIVLSENVNQFSKTTSLAIIDYVNFLKMGKDKNKYIFSDLLSFWGRGTQYLSLIKQSNDT